MAIPSFPSSIRLRDILFFLLAFNIHFHLVTSQEIADVTSTTPSRKQQELKCSFSEEIPLDRDGTVLMQQYVNRQEGTFSVRIRYTEGYSWIGIGINHFGNAYMVPAYAVIGRIQDDGTSSVGRYWLESAVGDGILPLDDPNRHLKQDATRFIQPDGQSILEFTHDLVILEDGVVYENVTAESTWIWAVGPEDNNWGSRHRLQGSFSITLTDCLNPDDFSSGTNDMAPGIDNNDALPWGDGGFDDYQGGVDEANSPVVSASSGTTIVLNESQIQSTRGLWIAHGLFMGFAWGLCAPLAIGASLFRKLGFLSNEHAWWFKLHVVLNSSVAILTVIGFFLAVRATNMVSGQSPSPGENHHKVGLTILLFVMVQCLLGYFRPSTNTTTTSENKNHERKRESKKHKKVSNRDEATIAIETDSSIKLTDTNQRHSPQSLEEQGFELDMTTISSLNNRSTKDATNGFDTTFNDDDDDSWSLFTPPPPPSSPPPDDDDECEGHEISDLASRRPEEKAQHQLESKQAGTSTPTVAASSDQAGTTSTLRTYWKYTHRIFGIVLLGLAWYNCHTGIVLFSEKYDADNERQLLNIFWGFTGTICVIFLLQGYVLRD